MKIRDLGVTPLTNRGLLLQVHTDEGITGLGAPMNYEHGRTVERAILDMAEYLIGRDPLQIEDHWQTLYRSSYSRQMPILLAALSGIEMACLDILGKSVGQPVWKLQRNRFFFLRNSEIACICVSVKSPRSTKNAGLV